MKRLTSKRTSILIGLTCIWLLIYGQLSLFALQVSAQDPAPTDEPPTPTATATPEITPTAGVPIAPTQPVPTPVRIVRFAVDDEDSEIEEGECVLFSWSVRGDIAWVEFDQEDDNRDPILVAETAERSECPTKDTEYQLKVAWLDGTRTSQKIEVEVRENTSSNTGGGDSSSSSGGDVLVSGGAASVPATGPFVAVTPILFQDISLAPSGVLETINTLPETGDLKEDNTARTASPWPAGLILACGIVALFAHTLRTTTQVEHTH